MSNPPTFLSKGHHLACIGECSCLMQFDFDRVPQIAVFMQLAKANPQELERRARGVYPQPDLRFFAHWMRATRKCVSSFENKLELFIVVDVQHQRLNGWKGALTATAAATLPFPRCKKTLLSHHQLSCSHENYPLFERFNVVWSFFILTKMQLRQHHIAHYT